MKSSRSTASASSRWLYGLAAILAVCVLAWPSAAQARKRLAVLEFTGPKADEFQRDLQKHLKKKHSVVPTAKWDKAADALRATKLSASNIKRVAAKLNLDGVIAGKIEKRGSRYYAHLTLYAGATGKSVKKVDLVERSAGLGPDGRADVDDQLLPFVDDLAAPGEGDDGEDDDVETDDDPRPAKARSKGKARDDDADDDDADDDDDDGGRAGWGRKSRTGARDDDADDDEPRAAKSKGKSKAKGKARDDDADDDDEPRAAKSKGKSKAKGKARDDDDADDDDDDAEGDDDDDDVRVASRDDRGRRGRDDDRDDDDDDRGGDDDDRGDRGGAPAAVDIAAGLSFTGRKLSFTTNLVANAPQGYDGAPVPGIRISADVFPLAMNKRNRSFTRNLGVTAVFDRVIKISSQLATQGMTLTLPTTEQHLALGVVYRHPVSAALTVEGSVRYNKRTFAIDKTGAPVDAVDIPNTDYTYVDPGVGVGYRLGPKLVLGADLRFLLITDTGEMQSPDQYGASTVTGVDLAANLDYQVARKVVIRLGAGLATIGYAFKGNGALTNNRDGDPTTLDVSGARDTYFGGSAGAVYQF